MLVINCGWPCCSQTPSLGKTNFTAWSAKLNKKSACQIRFGGGVENQPTLDVNLIKTRKTRKWDNAMISLCLFIVSQTHSQVRFFFKNYINEQKPYGLQWRHCGSGINPAVRPFQHISMFYWWFNCFCKRISLCVKYIQSISFSILWLIMDIPSSLLFYIYTAPSFWAIRIIYNHITSPFM